MTTNGPIFSVSLAAFTISGHAHNPEGREFLWAKIGEKKMAYYVQPQSTSQENVIML